jgi:hypothetical protein
MAITQAKIALGPLVGSRYVIPSGLRAGETVIVEGQDRVQPGTPVARAGHGLLRYGQRGGHGGAGQAGADEHAGQQPLRRAGPSASPPRHARPAGR